jgi:TonB family protein
MPERPHSTTDKLKLKVVDSVTAADKAPETSPKAAASAPMRKRHPDALKAILADPAATEDEWLAAAHEIELHGGIKTFDNGPLVQRARRRKRVLVIAAAVLVAGFGLVIADKKPVPMTPPAALGVPPPVAPADCLVDFGPYMANLQRQIKRQWFPPRGAKTTKVKVKFKVYKDGRMANLKILEHGPDQATDDAALLAVEHAAPSFKALPEGSPGDVDIEFKFDYSVAK